jgi:hypothetical protein
MTKDILCLANSRKLGDRCVAGRQATDRGPGPWIRPVSARPGKEVAKNERLYPDGSEPNLLDVIEVPLLHATPHACQVENWLLDPGYYWTRYRRANWAELLQYVESPATLWTNGYRTYHGLNDEIPQGIADALPGSLYLIHVDAVSLDVFSPSADFGSAKRRVRAQFSYRGIDYRFWVTDAVAEQNLLAHEDGHYTGGECCLTISLSEPFRSNRYKLVAAIVQRDETGAS